MAGQIIDDVADYDNIRALIDHTLDDVVLPDSVIELEIYLPRAERKVFRRFPDALTYTGEDLENVRLAAIYYTAALIAPSIPFYIRESHGDYSMTRSDEGWLAHAAKLNAKGDDALGDIDEDYIIPTIFTVAPGLRGY